MNQIPIIQRALAARDVEEVIDHYLAEGADDAALRFIGALEQAYNHLAEYPASGSPRYGHGLGIPGLRTWPLSGFPHLVFYIERDNHVDVWRVLHGQRDIPSWLQESD